MVGNQIVLVNRTQHPLKFTADGRQYTLQPGDNYGFVESQAQFAKAQNPLMGTEDYYSLEFESLVGVKGEDECSPISDETLEMVNQTEAERFNRERSGLRKAVKVVPRHRMPVGRTGGVTTGGNANAFAIGSGV